MHSTVLWCSALVRFCYLFCIACDVLHVLYLKKLYILKIRTSIEILAYNGSYVKGAKLRAIRRISSEPVPCIELRSHLESSLSFSVAPEEG